MVLSLDVTPPQTKSIFAQLSDSLSKYIVTPANAFGLGGFVFDIEGTTSISFNADITDHFLEDNTAVQDNIALRPQRITIRNYVGELVNRLDNTTATPVQKVVQKLTVLESYLPKLTAAAEQANSVVANFQSTGFASLSNTLQSPALNNLVDMWSLIKNLNPNVTKQQQAYMFFKALYEQRLLVSLQTPFEFITNLAIESIVATQDESSQYISDFSITLKKIRTVSIKNVSLDVLNYQQRNGVQTPDETENGKTEGQAVVPESILHKGAGFAGDIFSNK